MFFDYLIIGVAQKLAELQLTKVTPKKVPILAYFKIRSSYPLETIPELCKAKPADPPQKGGFGGGVQCASIFLNIDPMTIL